MTEARDGHLPALLLALTIVTGLVDATSYLKFRHVFVANMTGNVVFLGFGIAGAGGISVWASLTAIGSFLVGGVAGGRIVLAGGATGDATSPSRRRRTWCSSPAGSSSRRSRPHRSRKPLRDDRPPRRHHGRPERHREKTRRPRSHNDGADHDLDRGRSGLGSRGRSGSRLTRRGLSVAAMLLGALIGGVLVLKVDNPAPLALATGLLAVISFFAYRFGAIRRSCVG